MEWYEVLIGLGLLWFIGAQWDRGMQRRRKTRQEGKEALSLRRHDKTAASAPNKQAKPTEKLTAEQENQAAVRQAINSPEWKAKAKKARRKAEVMSRGLDTIPAETPRAAPKGEAATTPKPEPDPKPKPKPAKPREQWSAPYPVALRFTYCDSKGEVTTRELSNWRVSEQRLRGYDLDRGAARTFRLDRIEEVIEGGEALSEARANPEYEAPEPAPDRQRRGAPEIHFSGFDAATKSSLESTAESHGFKVRKSVTKNLDFFCRGPRPSQVKLTKAESKPGCNVIDKEGFLWVIATGEVRS